MKTKALWVLKAAVIVLAGCWVFSPVMHGGWLWDDDSYVTRNLMLRSPGGLWQIWFAPTGLNYFPVTSTVQWIQWHLWGDDPFGYHGTNVALHVASSLLFWRLLRKWGVPQAWLGGVLFAVHPVTVESVAWISEIKNTLSLPPLLLAMCAYVDYDARGARADYLRSAAWFLMAMLCKSTVAMFPVILLLYAWWRRGRIGKADLRASAVFFAISLVLGLVTVSFEHHRSMLGFDDTPVHGIGPRAAAAGLSVAFYLSKCLFPAGLLVTYPRWSLVPLSPLEFLPWLLLAALLAWLWTRRSTWGRHALFGLGCFGINLFPILGFVPMAYQRISWVADHFAYLPLLGLVGLATAAFGALEGRTAAGRPVGAARARFPGSRLALGSAAAVAIAALAWESHRYAAVFVDRRTLWTYTLQRNPASWSAHNDLGNMMLEAGRPAEAIGELEEALRLEPASAGAHNNMGAALMKLGRLPEAIAQYEEVLRLGADYSEVHYNLAMALAQTGRAPEAITHYQAALRLNPDFAEAHVNLGALLAGLGRLGEAITQFEQGVKLDPSDADGHADLGMALAQTGRFPDAIAQYRKVLLLRPDYPGIHLVLGNALFETGRFPEAADQYERALALNPDAETHNNLGLALRAMGRDGEARAHFEQAERLKAEHP